MTFQSSGNITVDRLGDQTLTGNIIPNELYHLVTRTNGKPHHLGIAILSDILYWYRPQVIVKEDTIIYKKKFKNELLQFNYSYYEEKFCESENSVRDAFKRLEELHLVTRHFRTVSVGGSLLPNRMFIELHIDQILPCLTLTPKETKAPEKKEGVMDLSSPIPETLEGDGMKFSGYTKIEPEINQEESLSDPTGRFDDYRSMIRENTDYDYLHTYEDEDTNILLDNLIDLMAESCVKTKDEIIRGEKIPRDLIRKRMLSYDSELLEYVLRNLMNAKGIRNPVKYMMTSLIQAPLTYHLTMRYQE